MAWAAAAPLLNSHSGEDSHKYGRASDVCAAHVEDKLVADLPGRNSSLISTENLVKCGIEAALNGGELNPCAKSISDPSRECSSGPSDEPPPTTATVDQFRMNRVYVDSAGEPCDEVLSRQSPSMSNDEHQKELRSVAVTENSIKEKSDEVVIVKLSQRSSNEAVVKEESNDSAAGRGMEERSNSCNPCSKFCIPGKFGGRWRKGVLQPDNGMLILPDASTSDQTFRKADGLRVHWDSGVFDEIGERNKMQVSKVIKRPAGSNKSFKQSNKEEHRPGRKRPASISVRSKVRKEKENSTNKTTERTTGKSAASKVGNDNKKLASKVSKRPVSPKNRGRPRVQKKEESSPPAAQASQSSRRFFAGSLQVPNDKGTVLCRALSEDLEPFKKKRKTLPFDRCAGAVPDIAPKIAARGARPCITLSGVALSAKVRRGLQKLGASIEANWTPKVSLVVANEFKRTLKIMCAICSGLPILTGYYLIGCELQGSWIDTRTYTLRDMKGERAFAKSKGLSSFSLSSSFACRKRQGPLFDGRAVCVLRPTPKHQRDELKCLVIAAGGAWSDDKPPSDPSDHDLCFVDPDTFKDESDLLQARRRAAPCALYNIELLFEACCTQQLRFDAFRL